MEDLGIHILLFYPGETKDFMFLKGDTFAKKGNCR